MMTHVVQIHVREMAFDITRITNLLETVNGAAQLIQKDIEQRNELGAERSITIKLSIDPDTLMVKSKVSVALPKEDHSWDLKKVAAFRENGELSIAEDEQKTMFD